jgi:hypothetical protein
MTHLIRQQLLPLEIGKTPVSVGREPASRQRILQLCPCGRPTFGYYFLKHFDPDWREYFVQNIFLYLIIHIHLTIYLLPTSGINIKPARKEANFWSQRDSLIMSIHLPIYLCFYLSIYLPIYLSTYLSTYLSIYLPTYLSIYLSVYLHICLSIYLG